ncbi:MAG: M1 family metallopeptidase [candidate division Zixibacteria bacterium]|nr:M1 family metallopeptidase [candidate division Zixibacteria bacterium]
MSKSLSFLRVLLILSTLLIITPAVQAGALADNLPDDLSPSQLHQIMGEQKALALDQARRQQSIVASAPATNQTDYDVRWYDINIRVNDTTEVLYGQVTIVADAVVDGVTEVEIDYGETMTVESIIAPSGSLSYTRSGDVVTVTLDGTYDAGETFQFDFNYSGHPVESGFQAFTFGWHGSQRSISSLSEPYMARTWWPCKDRMDDKPDSIGIHIEVDTVLYCASNGTLDSITTVPSSNSHTFHYTCHYPITTYLFSVAIADYIVWEQEYVYDAEEDPMPVIHHVYSDWYDYSLTTWGQTPQFIEVLVANYGPYPFLTEKYGHANFDWGGGMEHQTVTSMTGSSFGFYWAVVVHELGHQWWGDLVTCKSWRDIWLNEGWASYTEALYELETSGWADYHAYMNTMVYKGGGTIWVDDTTNVWRIFNGGLSYDKGAWVVHMLRGVLGEELFATGIEAYRTEFAYLAATTEDFRSCWEVATGVDLDPFINQWIYGQYYPIYEYYYASEPSDTGGYDIFLLVKQTQSTQPDVFEMPVDFFFDYTLTPDDTLTLVVDERIELFKFNQSSPVSQIKLDPAEWILKDAYDRSGYMFIITYDSELSDGVEGDTYNDTVEIRGGTGPFEIRVVSGMLPPGLTVDNNGVISGMPSQAGLFSFQIGCIDHGESTADQRGYDIQIEAASCCQGKVGDANALGGDEPTIGDVSVLIDAKFITGTCTGIIDCLMEADINQSGGIDPICDDITIGDVSILIDYLFITGASLGLPDCL